MTQLEERPSKIRRLDSDPEDNRAAEFAPALNVGFLNSEVVTSIQDDVAKASPSASKHDEDVSLCDSGDDDVHETKPSQPLSKNQLKKLSKKRKWEEGREYRKAKRREKSKQKKTRKAEARATVDPRSLEDTLPAPNPPNKTSQRPVQLPITFVIDCDFDELMTEAELMSLGTQLTRCYSDNRSAPFRARIVVSSFGGKLKHRFETVLASNHLGWKGVKFTAEDFVSAATEADAIMRGPDGGQLVGAFATVTNGGEALQRSPCQITNTSQPSIPASSRSPPASETAVEESIFGAKHVVNNGTATISMEKTHAEIKAVVVNDPFDLMHSAPREESSADTNNQPLYTSREPSIVYLTSDSPHTLDTLSPYTTYIIGGIVDKNRHKGICYKRAMARDIPTAKLPIGEYMMMQSRSVLATNHVAEIMVRWLEYGDWAKAFLQVIPKRKEARLKAKQGKMDDLRNEEDEHAKSSLQGDLKS